MKKNNDKDNINDFNYWLPLGLCIGISFGMTTGLLRNNIPLWLSIGTAIGLCVGLVLSNNKSNKDK